MVSGAKRDGEADHRGGQPARGLLIIGKALEDALRSIQCGDSGFLPARGQRDRGADQVWLWLGPGLAMRHVLELVSQVMVIPRLGDFADGQLVDDHAGGELPVAGFDRVPHRREELAVPLVPLGGPPVQQGHPVRVLHA